MTFNRLYLVALALLALLAASPPYFVEIFELKVYDLLTRYTAPKTPDPRIAIVGIDQKSLDLYGRWPWKREAVGELIAKLKAFGVAVTALDVGFFGETDPDNDIALTAAVAAAGNVVTGYEFHNEEERSATAELTRSKRASLDPFAIKLVSRDEMSAAAAVGSVRLGEVSPNIPAIQAAGAATGYFNIITDRDGTIRLHPLLVEHEGALFPSLALAAAAFYEGKLGQIVAYYEQGRFVGFALGERFYETDPFATAYLRYRGPDGTFPVVSAADVMDGDPATDEALRKRLEGKIVFVGATATGIYDLRVTPFGIVAGVEIHANLAANLLNGTFIQKFAMQDVADIVAVLVIGLFLLVFLQRAPTILGALATMGLLAAVIGFNYWLFDVHRLWLNSVLPTATILLGFTAVTVHRVREEQKSRAFITGAFGHYLSPKLIDQIVDHPDLLKLGGEKKEITAFFSDVVGFTTISEKLSAPQLSALLNEYLTEMTDIIQEGDGTVDKFIGDAVVAMWGAPVTQADHALRGVRSAVAQQRRLAALREQWRSQGKEELFIRIGVNTGVASIGNMGSKSRFDYTMLGDTVNLAARLEGANKYYGSSILITEFTHVLVHDHFFCRPLDRVRVQGKKDAILLYEVVDDMGAVTDAQRRFARMWRLALSLFHQMRFERAAQLFEACDRLKREGDGACKLYMKRCAELIASPPPEDWDRVYDLAK
jgi:adenylate cyclase